MYFDQVDRAPVPAYQNLSEFGMLWEFVAARSPKAILEIGALFGGTLWYWLQMQPDLLVSADMLAPESHSVYEGVVEARKTWSSWDWFGVEFHDIVGDTHQQETLDRVMEVLGQRKFDFAFIDGDHSYEGVKRDFEMYSPLVNEGGIVAFHDTIQNGSRHEPGVVAFVGELKWRYPWAEFFHWDGAGICAFVLTDERP